MRYDLEKLTSKFSICQLLENPDGRIQDIIATSFMPNSKVSTYKRIKVELTISKKHRYL